MKNHLEVVKEELQNGPVNKEVSGFPDSLKSPADKSPEEWPDYLMPDIIKQRELQLKEIRSTHILIEISFLKRKWLKDRASFGDEDEKRLSILNTLSEEMKKGEYKNVENFFNIREENKDSREEFGQKTTNDSQKSPSGSSPFRGISFDKNTTQIPLSDFKVNSNISEIVKTLESQKYPMPYYETRTSLLRQFSSPQLSPQRSPKSQKTPTGMPSNFICTKEGSLTWRKELNFDTKTTLNSTSSAKGFLNISQILRKYEERSRLGYSEPTARDYIPSDYSRLSSSQSQLSPNDNSWPRGQVKVRARFFNSLTSESYTDHEDASSQNSSSTSSDLYDLGIYELTSPKSRPLTQRSIEFQPCPTGLPPSYCNMQGSTMRRYTDELLSLSPDNPRTRSAMDDLRADYFERSSLAHYSNVRKNTSSYFVSPNRVNVKSNAESDRRSVDEENQYKNYLSSSLSSSPSPINALTLITCETLFLNKNELSSSPSQSPSPVNALTLITCQNLYSPPPSRSPSPANALTLITYETLFSK